ncbi:rabphilin [Lycorma delicatula]|uniref:rabphilin n=1 Tax=Lycorma delicatula TaxID=130591 RepID=UPI003F515255
MVDLGNQSVKHKWVCPNDRMLALRARVSVGWSVKTQDLNSCKQDVPTLDEEEQKIIKEVIKRAEDLETLEQQRVGRLVERLDIMKRKVVGTGINQCKLCGDNFSVLGSHGLLCHDCNKAVCQKCGVETFSSTKKETVWRCKICAETREMWKKSGAWFFKGLPKYVLPPKNTALENKYAVNRRPGLKNNNWSRASNSKPQARDEESSSDDEVRPRIRLNSRTVETSGSSRLISSDRKIVGTGSSDVISVSDSTSMMIHSDDDKAGKLSLCSRISKWDMNEGSEMGSLNSCLRRQSSESGSSYQHLRNFNGDMQLQSTDNDLLLQYPNILYSWRDSQFSLAASRDWYSESDRGSLSGSSLSGHRTAASVNEDGVEDLIDTQANADGSLGTIELTLVYDTVASSIHVSLHRAKNLKPMDINGLADPFCKLNILPVGVKSHRLRTRTVHKTRNPEFNETLTFYGVTETDLRNCAIHILVLDDDKYGHDFMGETRFSLDRLKPDVPRHLCFYLEKHYPVESEELVWGEEGWSHGQILITLCYSTRRKALLVGIIRCANLPPMDNNGFSDPFVKLSLKPDPLNRKFKTSVKRKNLNPLFNEEFAFETKMTDLPLQTLTLTVWDKDYGKSNDYLGCLEISCKSKGDRLRHWVDMIKFPDHKHEGLHNLCDSGTPPQH